MQTFDFGINKKSSLLVTFLTMHCYNNYFNLYKNRKFQTFNLLDNPHKNKNSKTKLF